MLRVPFLPKSARRARPAQVLSALVLPALALLVGGCTHDGVGSALSLEDLVQPRAQMNANAMALAPGRERAITLSRPAMVSLPGEAGKPGAPRTRDYSDGLRLDIALDGARVPLVTNGITLVARSGPASDPSLERVSLQPPSEPMIRSEIGAAMPHVKMQVVEQERSNDYGAYGLALGRVGADTRCLYMWQWIEASRLPREDGLAGPASLRVRLCRAGTTFDEMAGWTDHLRLDAGAAVASADDGRVLPPTALPEPDVGKPSRASRAERHAEKHAGRRRFAERHLAHRPIQARLARTRLAKTRLAGARPTMETPVATPVGDGPRYLTPDIAPPIAARAQPVVASSPAPKFGGDLPPEAFAGPRAIPSPRS